MDHIETTILNCYGIREAEQNMVFAARLTQQGHRSQLKMAPMQDDTLYNMTDNTEYQATGAVNIDNMYEFASSHCNDFKNLRDDEDIVINREWILNKLAEAENE